VARAFAGKTAMLTARAQHAQPHLPKGLLAALALALPLGIAAGTVLRAVRVPEILQAFQPPAQLHPELEPQLVEIPPHPVQYRPAGSFSKQDAVADAPLVTIQMAQPLHIMRNQVSSAGYERCVAAGGCKAARRGGVAANVPAVKISWEDAAAYAVWLSRETGISYRLPTDEEWMAAAGSRMPENAVIASSATNPATRWLAQYDAEASLDAVEATPKPFGSFGINEYGAADLGGNVWEWTDSCFVRAAISDDGRSFKTATVNCGVRVAEGQHRAYLPDFIRDARGGACSTGKPPSNLGFRLVSEGPQSSFARPGKQAKVSHDAPLP
jgi:formylglycine-generating enzyme required for sulfatase activity